MTQYVIVYYLSLFFIHYLQCPMNMIANERATIIRLSFNIESFQCFVKGLHKWPASHIEILLGQNSDLGFLMRKGIHVYCGQVYFYSPVH